MACGHGTLVRGCAIFGFETPEVIAKRGVAVSEAKGNGLRTLVVFKSSAFNTTTPMPHFINECCFGDDLANWFINRLRALGLDTDDAPGQEDFGWFLGYRTTDGRYTLVLGYRPDDPSGDWICWVERDCGFFRSLFGGRKRKITRSAVEAIHAAILNQPEVSEVRWFTQQGFDAGEREPSPMP
jgi:hypothetical protein